MNTAAYNMNSPATDAANALAELAATWYEGRLAPARGDQAARHGSDGVLRPGSLLADRYRLDQPIGLGGFATVYEAFDLTLRRPVAVKVYPSGSARIAGDESRLQALAQHPNVMPLHDRGHDALLGVGFNVMPLYPGADLAASLARLGPLPFRPALLLADQICTALEFLHTRRRTIHSDVKPGNIWLTRGPAAPEALEGDPTPPSDVFSLGCVLYTCLTGTPPFGDDAAARRGRPTRLGKLRSDVRPELEAVIHAAISPSPERRWQSPREFQTALRNPSVAAGHLPGRLWIARAHRSQRQLAEFGRGCRRGLARH